MLQKKLHIRQDYRGAALYYLCRLYKSDFVLIRTNFLFLSLFIIHCCSYILVNCKFILQYFLAIQSNAKKKKKPTKTFLISVPKFFLQQY